MKNETNTPAPTGQDLFEAWEKGWRPHKFFSEDSPNIAFWLVNLDKIEYMESPPDGIVCIPWPEYYRMHCLSRPFKPEEWGWREKVEDEYVATWFEGDMCLLLSKYGHTFTLILNEEHSMPFSIPTAREYLALAGMLGIETEKTKTKKS